jgi:hypothetical protein
MHPQYLSLLALLSPQRETQRESQGDHSGQLQLDSHLMEQVDANSSHDCFFCGSQRQPAESGARN